jgi:hypothetical protein
VLTIPDAVNATGPWVADAFPSARGRNRGIMCDTLQ